MQNTPDIEMLVLLDVEHEKRKPLDWPRPKPRQSKLVGVPGRARGRIAADVPEGVFERVDERQRYPLRRLVLVVRNSLLDIPDGELPQK